VGTYSGVIGAVFSGAQQALLVWQQYINAHGGLNGHPVHLYSEDDGGDPSTSVSEVEQEVTQDHVLAFIGDLVPLTLTASLSYLQQQDIPVIGGDGTNNAWWQSPVLFPQTGSGLNGDADAVALKVAVAKGYTKLGVLYCVEDPECTLAYEQLVQQGAAQAVGATPVYSASFSITQPDFTAQCLDAKQAGVTVIYFAGDAGSLLRMDNDCVAQGYNPLFVALSLAVNASLESDPHLDGLISAQTDFPWIDSFTPAQATYQAAMKSYDPSLAGSGGSAATSAEWTSGMLLVAADQYLTENPTTAEIFRGLWSIKNNNLGGLAPPLTFNANADATPSPCYFLMTLQNGQFADTNAGSTQCTS
jgi:branched-chain amino acid transport system substrate-binding protein